MSICSGVGTRQCRVLTGFHESFRIAISVNNSCIDGSGRFRKLRLLGYNRITQQDGDNDHYSKTKPAKGRLTALIAAAA
ncbi:hypothetical protein H6F74_24295 [Trichocoleus sp. FACHB-90]|uniref:hypothetical protein n=1 Tax=Cyanophyceae TaxID=3028117 RepID=UPI001684132F|nr:hypothetical protein [Trichocoleus sp. FACHB-90]MBD1929337.1 hypothetical protein [Trichocoleus sp. FACHB-90]